MIIVKTIFLGLASLIIGNLLSFIFLLLFGFVIEIIIGKILSESSLKTFRHISSYFWVGFSIGLLHSISIYYFTVIPFVLLITFLVYLVFFMRHKTPYVYSELCSSDDRSFNKLSRVTEVFTFIGYIISSFGLWTVLNLF